MRTTCLRCEQEGETTLLVVTSRGGVCPVHDAEFLQRMVDNAKKTLGIPLKLNTKGAPRRPGK
jgi:hypothetical protein